MKKRDYPILKITVELTGKKQFQFMQRMASDYGSVIDLSMCYNSDLIKHIFEDVANLYFDGLSRGDL